MDIPIDMVFVVRMTNAGGRTIHAQPVHKEGPQVGTKGVMDLPRAEVARDERVSRVGVNGAGGIVAEAEGIDPVAV